MEWSGEIAMLGELPQDLQALQKQLEKYPSERVIKMILALSNSDENTWQNTFDRFSIFLKLWENIVGTVPWNLIKATMLNTAGFNNLMHCLKLSRFITEPPCSVPVAVFFQAEETSRNSVEAHIKLIGQLIDAPKEIFSFSDFSGRPVIPRNEFPPIHTELKNSSWNSYDLFEFLFEKIGTVDFDQIKPIFEKATKRAPEMLCIALSTFSPQWNSILKEILVKMVTGYIAGQHSSGFVLAQIWHKNSQMLLLCMVEMHRRDPLSCSRLLDVALDLKILNIVLETRPWSFAIDLAILASRRQHLNLEKWLKEQLEGKVGQFARGCVEYVSGRVETDKNKPGTSAPLNSAAIDSLRIVLRAIRQFITTITTTDISATEISELEVALGRLLPGSPNYNTATSPGTLQSGIMAGFHPDVENIVNGYFESLFAGQLSSEDLVKVLRNLKTSTNVHERHIYDCLVRNLFEEFKFFPNYPEKELETVAVFVGQIIASDLLHPTSQSTALTFVLDALKKPVGSRLFQFSQLSLLHFYHRIPEWMQFMETLTRSLHYEFIPEIIRSHLSSISRLDNAANVEQVDSLKAALSVGPIKDPPEKIRERILFSINNLTEENLASKAEDIRSILSSSEYFPWFVEYIMSERIILESNFHGLYNELIDSISSPGLLDMFMTGSTSKARRLLLAFDNLPVEKRDSIHLRSILKNLAQWIGLMFFSRDRPVLRREVCLKTFLVSQSNNDYYTFVLPFTCKLLEKSTLSTILTPSNPWISSLLRLLVEIYLYVDLKLNSKFEIELLFKSLGVDMKGVQPSNIIRRRLSRPPSATATSSRSSAIPKTTVNEMALAEIGSAQVERVCSIAIKTIQMLIQKDLANIQFQGELTNGVAIQLFEATSREAIRSILFNTYRKYLTSSMIPFDEDRLIELVDSSYPTVLASTHDLIRSACYKHIPDPTSTHPNAAVSDAYQELMETVGHMEVVIGQPLGSSQAEQPPAPIDISASVSSILAEIELMVSKLKEVSMSDIGPEHEAKGLMKKLVSLAATDSHNRDEACLVISQKLIQLLFRTDNSLIIDIAIVLLAKIFEYSSRVSKEVTNWILVSNDERKYNVGAMSALLASGLVYVLDFDVQLARQIESSANKVTSFSIDLIRRCVLSTPPIAAPYDLVYSLEALGRILKKTASTAASTPSSLVPVEIKDIMGLMEDISKKIASEPAQQPEGKLREVVSFWFSDWFRLCQYPSDSSKQVSSFLSQLSQKDFFFQRADKVAIFFRICAEVSVELFLHQKHAPSVLSLRGVECYIKLVVGLATWPPTPSPSVQVRKGLIGNSELLKLAMSEFIGTLLAALPQQPILMRAFARSLTTFATELSKLQTKGRDMKPYYLVLADMYDAVNPMAMPVALASWLEAVSSKHFMKAFLFDFPEDGAVVLGKVLKSAVEYLSQPVVIQGARSSHLTATYQAVLRLFVGIAHDLPELLLRLVRDLLQPLDIHYIQLRNLLLATIPASMALPDPFAPDFSFERIASSMNLSSSQLLSAYETPVGLSTDSTVMASIDGAVSKCCGANGFDAAAFLLLPSNSYDLFSLSLYSLLSSGGRIVVTVERLAEGLEKSLKALLKLKGNEGAYRLLFALTDNLRFPCSETHFFVRLFLALFNVSSDQFLKELITRVLLERLIVHKPHPWGLIVCFLELIKRPDLGFWKCSFTSKTPEIRRMFESVAKTCGGVIAAPVK